MRDKEMVRYLSGLGKLSLTEQELESFAADMERILEIMDSINEVEITGEVYQEPGVAFGDLRQDEKKDSTPTETILQNAKEKQDNAFVVPKLF